MSNKYNVKTFKGMILALQDYWANQGCTIVQPFDMEVGAGTIHPMTCLRALGTGTDGICLCATVPSSGQMVATAKTESFTTLLSIPSSD